jgi:hypothetical protein
MNFQNVKKHAVSMIREGDTALATVFVEGLMKQLPRSRYELGNGSNITLGVYPSGRIYVGDSRPHIQLAILNVRLNRPISALNLLAEAEDTTRFGTIKKLRDFINRKCGFPHMNYNIEYFAAQLSLLRDFEKVSREVFVVRLVSHGVVCTVDDLAAWESGLSLTTEQNLLALQKLPVASRYSNLTEFRSILSLMIQYRKLEPK